MHSLDNMEFDNRQDQIEKAEKMQRLLDNSDFKELFQNIYIDAFAITNLYNLHGYDDPTRRNFLEKSLARSIFVKFIDGILEEGREAKMSIHDELMEEQGNGEESSF